MNKIDLENGPEAKPKVTVEPFLPDHLKYDHAYYGLFGFLLHIEDWMGQHLGVEIEAIERKTDIDRKPMTWADAMYLGMLWASGTINMDYHCLSELGPWAESPP